MNGMSASIQGIASRSVFLLLLACATTSPQATGDHGSGTLKSFHDDILNITYFYPANFVPAPPASTPPWPVRRNACNQPYSLILLHRSRTRRSLSPPSITPVPRSCAREPTRPLHPRTDCPSTQTVRRPDNHSGAHQLYNCWPPCFHHRSLSHHPCGSWQSRTNNLRRQGMRVGLRPTEDT
jgi:hypothetical protein